MSAHDLIGLREDELDAAEREALHTLLEQSPEARLEHQEAQQLGQTLASLPGVEGGPSAAEILRRARSPDKPVQTEDSHGNPWIGRLGFLAVAAAVLLAVGLQTGPQTRARGTASPDAFVHLEAVAEGPAVHALENEAQVAAGESVVFQVSTGRPGNLVLVEHGPAGTVEVLRWSAAAGSAPLGGASPLAWTPDDTRGGARKYVVEWCDEGGVTCAEDELVLHWSPR